jgi:hypothetical protein
MYLQAIGDPAPPGAADPCEWPSAGGTCSKRLCLERIGDCASGLSVHLVASPLEASIGRAFEVRRESVSQWLNVKFSILRIFAYLHARGLPMCLMRHWTEGTEPPPQRSKYRKEAPIQMSADGR